MPCALEALTVIKTFSGRSTIQFVREQVKCKKTNKLQTQQTQTTPNRKDIQWTKWMKSSEYSVPLHEDIVIHSRK